ncbi:hypothetical protein Pla8534_55970 [Lignipirellula cremea]|uniref:Uncharacterized protein n=1 Tax=Lignipirellula cremea TaxID=2528010 RepID=A0A518E0Y9_9BACT|nr:hypothetical protein Pla8534_55970 [Lignipirellula cremea]
MVLFSIHCETCKAKLTVRSVDAIGQILACPKCAGMVLIQPPAGWVPPDDTAAAATAAASGVDIMPRKPAPEAPAPEAPAAATTAPETSPANQPTAGQEAAPGPSQKTADKSRHAARTSTERQPPVSDDELAQTKDLTGDVFTAGPPADIRNAGDDDETVDADQTLRLEARQAAVRSEKAAAFRTDEETPPSQPAAESGDISAPPIQHTDLADAPSEPLLPGDEWSAPAARQWRQIALMAGAGVAGVALALGLFALFVSQFSSAASPQPVAITGAGGGLRQADPSSGDTPLPRPSDEPSIALPPAAETPVVPPPALPTVKRPEVDIDDTAAPVQPPSPADDEPADPAKVDTATLNPATDPMTDPMIDPAGPKPPAVDAPGVDAPGVDPPAVDAREQIASLGESLSEFAPFFESATREAPSTAPKDEDAKHAESEPTGDEIVGDDVSLARPAPLKVDIPARLNDIFPSIEIPGSPLSDFLSFTSQLSAIPVTIDPAAIENGLQFDKPVSLKLSNATLGQILKAGLSPQGLEAIDQGTQLLVTRRAFAEPGMQTKTHSLGDLAATDEQRQAVLELVKTAAPGDWTDLGGAGKISLAGADLSVTQPMPVQARIVTLLQRLRVARGQRPLYGADPATLSPTPRVERAAVNLNKRLTLNFLQPTLLTTVLDRLQNESGVRLLVDWQAIGEEGWNPSAEVTLSVEKGTLGAALDDLLTRMNLTVRVLDANLLQVTTPQRLAESLDVEMYPAGDLLREGDTAEALLKRIRAKVGETAFADKGGPGEIAYDAASQHVVAVLPQPLQVELKAALHALRGEK